MKNKTASKLGKQIKAIEELIRQFDFEKTRKVMEFTGHKWKIKGKTIVPTIDEMKMTVRTLAMHAFARKPVVVVQGGGFTLERSRYTLKLTYSMLESEVELIDSE